MYGKIQFTPLKFQRFFNLNLKVLKLPVYSPKVSKLAVYSPKVSKSSNLNLPLKWTEIKKNSLRAVSSFHSFPSNLTKEVDKRFKLPLFETSNGVNCQF
jgi:ribonuclease BN (tRNA processing enzyme)